MTIAQIKRHSWLVVAFVIPFLTFGISHAQKADDGRVKVFIFSAVDPSGFTDQTTKDRIAAVADANEALAKSKLIRIVSTRDEAQVVLEITKRVNELAKTGMGASMLKNNSFSRSPDSLKPFLYGTLTLPTDKFSTELRSAESDPSGKAQNLAKVLEQWVKDNRDKLKRKDQPGI